MPQPGDIVVVDFPGVQGVKRRPAIVVSSDAYHQARTDVIVGLITSQVPTTLGPFDRLITDWRAAGLNKPSLFRAFLVTLPRRAISTTIGRPTPADWQAIKECVKNTMHH